MPPEGIPACRRRMTSTMVLTAAVLSRSLTRWAMMRNPVVLDRKSSRDLRAAAWPDGEGKAR